MPESRIVEAIRRQQASLAEFGAFAFSEENLSHTLAKAALTCANGLKVPYAKIYHYRPENNDLLIVAGCGWRAGIVGHMASKADESSTQGRAFVTGEPVTLEDVTRNNSFALPPFYAEHSIVSTADVLIKSNAGPWGVLEVASPTRRIFDKHDIAFLTGFANVVAEAVVTDERSAAMQAVIEKMELLIAEKDELVAERTGREFRLHELEAELLQMSRVNAMSQMTAAIAHELNQPLAAIANYVSAAKRTLDSPAFDSSVLGHVRELTDKAQRQTLRAGNIIRTLRDLVEKRENCPRAENVSALVEESLTLMLFGAAEANIAVIREFDDGVPPAWIDKIQIQQTLINLIRNSIEAMLDADQPALTLSTGLGEAGFVDVIVSDSGPGLPSDVLRRLFLPFNSTKSSGMGLGLMICHTLTEANGGRIAYLRDRPKGAGFRLSLPVVPTAIRESHRIEARV